MPTKCGLWLVYLVVSFLVWGCSQDESTTVKEQSPGQVQELVVSEPAPVSEVPQQTGKNSDNDDTGTGSNRPPTVVSVEIEPFPAFPGTELAATVNVEDEDGDIVTLEYEWKVNGETMSAQILRELDTTGLKKGDLVSVVVTPFDGKVAGEPEESLPVLLHNRPPEITSIPSTSIVDGEYTYQVVASDPDEDTLVFELVEGGEGMEIDAENGVVHWQIPQNLEGDFTIKIIVSDGDAKAYQAFSMRLGSPSP